MAAFQNQQLTFDVVLEPSEQGGFTVYVPSLRGCVSEGETEADALSNIEDAIQVWLDSWDQVKKDGSAAIRQVVINR